MTLHHDWETLEHQKAPAQPAWAEGGVFLRHQFYRRQGKRWLDIVLVAGTLPVWGGIVLIVAFAIMISGQVPFYRQTRLGRGNQPFRMWKLRSMVSDADAALAAHLENCDKARAEWEHSQKLKDDPRVTRIGGFIRKTSLDELPQLWNVLIGDMSLVGPRPMLPEQRTLYEGQAYPRLRPGVTGPWQISERNEIGFSVRARFDDAYERQMSLLYDLRIILRTFGVVARGTGY